MPGMHTVFHAVKSIFFTIALAYCVISGLIWLMQARLIYYPVKGIEALPSDIGLEFEAHTLQSQDSTGISAWFVPARERRGTVLVCHGNAGNISHRLDTIRIFNSLGLDVMIFDYRGYGMSTGRPTESGTYRDAETAVKWLTEEEGIPLSEIVIMGRSLGGAIAARTARDYPPKALILESSFTSAKDLGVHFHPWLPVRLLMRYEYPTLKMLESIDCPVLVVHSPDDEIIPYAMGRRLYEAAHGPKQFLELSGGHNEGFLMSERRYTDGLDRWLAEVLD